MQTQSWVNQLGESARFTQVFPDSEMPKIDRPSSTHKEEQPFKAELKQLEPSLTPSAFKLFSLLHDAALTIANHRGYRGVASGALCSLTLFCPKEVVARALELDPRTIYRAAKLLKEKNLLDNRPIKSTLKGEKRNAGMLWKVKLNPIGENRVKLNAEELSHQWRDMDADAKQCRYAMYRKDLELEEGKPQGTLQSEEAIASSSSNAQTFEPVSDIYRTINTLSAKDKVLEWALPPLTNEINSLSISDIPKSASAASLTTILDVDAAPFNDFEARQQAVNIAAQSLSLILGDTHSLNYWRNLLWQLLRCNDLSQGNYFFELYEQARTVEYDGKSEAMKRPAAVLISRLKTKPWYEHVLRDVPRYPVAKNSRNVMKN